MKEQWFQFNEEPLLYPINEAYFGETPPIQRIQRAMTNFRSKWSAKQYQYKPEALQSKEMKELCSAFEDAFGFEIFTLTIIPSIIKVGACTFPVGARWDEYNTKKNIIITKNGYRYKKEAGYATWVLIDGGIIYNTELYTDREVLGIILHEIGHNFASKNGHLNMLRNISSVVSIISGVLAFTVNPMLGIGILFGITENSLILKSFLKLNQYLYKEFPKAMLVGDYLFYGFSMVFDIVGEVQFLGKLGTTFLIPGHFIGYILGRIYNILKPLASTGPGYLVTLIGGYPEEQFADTFSTMYGYGPDLHSGLDKLSSNQSQGYVTQEAIAKNAPIILAINDLCLLPIIIGIAPLDEHPAVFERLMNSIRVLEREAEECHDPRMRKRLKEDIKKLNKSVEEYYTKRELNQKTMGDYKRTNWFSRYYWAFMIKLFGGDLRHHIADKIFDATGSLTTKGDEKDRSR